LTICRSRQRNTEECKVNYMMQNYVISREDKMLPMFKVVGYYGDEGYH